MSREKSRKCISSSDLKTVLNVVHEKSVTEKTRNTTSYNFKAAYPYIKDRGLGDHVLPLEKAHNRRFPLNSDRNPYEIANIILRNMEIELEPNLCWDKDLLWVNCPLRPKWHFEYCRFKPSSSSMQGIPLGWLGSFRFYNNEFAFNYRDGDQYWLFCFASGSRVAFERNNFNDSSIQVRCIHETTCDEGSTDKLGLGGISFSGNKKIDILAMRCRASDYVFDGLNDINYLVLDESSSNFSECESIYFGSRERIDPNFHYTQRHRRLFVTIREYGVNNHDTVLVNSSDKHLSRLEYFLTKEQKVPFRIDGFEWFEYWQDRLLCAWRRWSTDFDRSWARPLIIGVIGYLILNAAPKLWIGEFSVSDWVAFSLRRIDRIPFFTVGLEELHDSVYDGLSPVSKNWLRFIGFFQLVWTTIWGFAFYRSIRRRQ